MKNKLFRINIFCIAALTILGSYFNRKFTLDDALIYQRYLKNFFDGNGLVYNIGEKFNGLTSPLYIYLCMLMSVLRIDIASNVLILNCLLLISAAIVLALIFYNMDQPQVGFISSVVLVTSKYSYLVFGMETNLFIFMSLCCIYFYFKKQYTLLSVFSAGLFLTRGEGVFLLIILFFLIVKENRKDIKLKYFVIFILILSANYLFNFYYYGYLFPQTLSAKIAQGSSGLWGRFGFLTGANILLDIAFNKQLYFVIVLLIFSLTGLVNHYKEKFLLILIVYNILITLFYVSLNIPNYHWYYSILFLTFFILISYGSYDIYSFLKEKFSNAIPKYFIMALIFIYPAIIQIQMFILLQKQAPHKEYVIIGEWLRNYTPPDSKIAAVEIGNLGWYSERYIVDILGLVNPLNADFIGQKQFSKWFDFYKPDYIVVHDPYWSHEQGIPELVEKGYFYEDKSFSIAGYKLLKLNKSGF